MVSPCRYNLSQPWLWDRKGKADGSDDVGSDDIGSSAGSSSGEQPGEQQGGAPAFFCVRVSWDGESSSRIAPSRYELSPSLATRLGATRTSHSAGYHIRQLCDPNDADGRTTGAVPAAILEFWHGMKRAHFIDAQAARCPHTQPRRTPSPHPARTLPRIRRDPGP